MSGTAPELVVLGNLLVDDVVAADGRTRMAQPGGAILYASLAAALWGARVGCVSLRGDDYPTAALDALQSRGVSLTGVHALGSNGVRTWLLYEGAIRRVVHRLGCPSHEAVSPRPEHVPEAWRRARAFHLAPMPIETQRALVLAIRGWESSESPALVSLDPHLPLDAATFETWRELLSRVDLFLPSDDEMRWEEARHDPARAFIRLASGRLRFVAWKRGANGGTLYDARERSLRSWRPATTEVRDATGAGDAFMAGFVTATLAGSGVEDALKRAAVTAGIAISDVGADALLRATPQQLADQLATWKG